MPANAAQSPSAFRCGEGDGAVLALIEACKQAPRGSLERPALPHLVGRTLEPYFSADEELPRLLPAAANTAKHSSQSGGKAHKRKSGAGGAGTATPPAAPHVASPTGSPPKQQQPGHHHKAAKAAKQAAGASPLTQPARPAKSQPQAVPRAVVVAAALPSPHRHSMNGMASSPPSSTSRSFAYACPGAFNSPKPEALPMPTSRLLSRAVSALTGSPPAQPALLVMA